MNTLDIINLIDKNSITRLSKDYDNKLINKIKTSFTDTQQQIFVASFYCYLNYDTKKDFVIDFDNVWKWLGYTRKDHAKTCLENHFVVDIDYKVVKIATATSGAAFEDIEKPAPATSGAGSKPTSPDTKNIGGAGKNKERILLSVNTFKKICMKANTKKSDEVHEYYIKLEELLHDTVDEQTDELRLQLCHKDELIKTIKTEHNTLVSDHKMLQMNHNNILKRRSRQNFERGNVIYIISHEAFTSFYKCDYFKIGKSTQKKDETTACFKRRLSAYNTCSPVNYTVHYLLYVEDNDMIEQSLKMKYFKNLKPSNKEWIKDVKLEDIVGFIRQLRDLIKLPCNEVVLDKDQEDEEDEVQEEPEEDQEPELEEEQDEEEEEQEDDKEKEDNEEQEEDIKRQCRKCNKKKQITMFKRHGPNGHSLSCLECDKHVARKLDICMDCNVILDDVNVKKCVDCTNKNIKYKERPSYERLNDDLVKMSYVACGIKYGVSDNAIRKWLRTYEGNPVRKPVFKV